MITETRRMVGFDFHDNYLGVRTSTTAFVVAYRSLPGMLLASSEQRADYRLHRKGSVVEWPQLRCTYEASEMAARAVDIRSTVEAYFSGHSKQLLEQAQRHAENPRFLDRLLSRCPPQDTLDCLIVLVSAELATAVRERQAWKTAWFDQRDATGISYWAGYQNGKFGVGHE